MPTGSVHPVPHAAAHMATAGPNANIAGGGPIWPEAGGGRGTVGPQYRNIDICRVLMAARRNEILYLNIIGHTNYF